MNKLVALRRATIVLLVLSIALGALTVRAMTDSRHWTEDIDSAMVNYALAERSLQLNLLDERAGLVRNYDAVNADLVLADSSLERLRHAKLETRASNILAVLIARNSDLEDMVEEFNGDNALLQNALSYITNHASDIPRSQLLFNRILKLTLDTSPTTVRDAHAALARMTRQPEGLSAGRLISYARLLVDTLPRIDSLLSSIRALKVEDHVNDLQHAVRDDMLERAARVTHLQLASATAIILLIFVSTGFLLAQRLHTRELQARAANARLSAAIAIPLIDTGPETFHARIQEAADRLALHVGAERLQLAIPGFYSPLQFSRHGPLPADWLDRLSDAATAADAWFDNRVIASTTASGADTSLGVAMRDLGTGKLVLLRTVEPFRVVIGFQPKDLAIAQRSDYLAGLASALIAIAHSARREVLQIERERLERRLAAERIMANLGIIASGVAHNFNNIIGAISGFAEIGQAHTQARSVEHNSFQEIQGSVDRARDLIDDVLSLAKRRISSQAPLHLNQLLDQTARMLAASARSNSLFNLEPNSGDLLVYGSESDLQQVFLNLCNNAAHASEGRPVRITSESIRLLETRRMSHKSLHPGKYAVVSVTDSGPGIADSIFPRLFEPFFTTKPAGTGLGLSTAWEIIQQHGGAIHVETADGGGSCFSVWLPEITTDTHRAVPGNGESILLLADPDRLSAEEEMLAELGYEPRGFPLSIGSAQIVDMIPHVDAILIATCESWRARKIVLDVGPYLDGCPLLLAAVCGEGWRHPPPAIALAYPIRAAELWALMSQAISARSIALSDTSLTDGLRSHDGLLSPSG